MPIFVRRFDRHDFINKRSIFYDLIALIKWAMMKQSKYEKHEGSREKKTKITINIWCQGDDAHTNSPTSEGSRNLNFVVFNFFAFRLTCVRMKGAGNKRTTKVYKPTNWYPRKKEEKKKNQNFDGTTTSHFHMFHFYRSYTSPVDERTGELLVAAAAAALTDFCNNCLLQSVHGELDTRTTHIEYLLLFSCLFLALLFWFRIRIYTICICIFSASSFHVCVCVGSGFLL